MFLARNTQNIAQISIAIDRVIILDCQNMQKDIPYLKKNYEVKNNKMVSKHLIFQNHNSY